MTTRASGPVPAPRLPDETQGLGRHRACALPSCSPWTGCPKDKPEGTPPPTADSSSSPAQRSEPGGGGSILTCPGRRVPRTRGGYCVDPHGNKNLRRKRRPKPIDAICTEAFNGECEIYKSFGSARSPSSDMSMGRLARHGRCRRLAVHRADGAYACSPSASCPTGIRRAADSPKALAVDGVGPRGSARPGFGKARCSSSSRTPMRSRHPIRWLQPARRCSRPCRGDRETAARSATMPTAGGTAAPGQPRFPSVSCSSRRTRFEVEGRGRRAGFYRDGEKRYRCFRSRVQTRSGQGRAQESLTSKRASTEKDIGEARCVDGRRGRRSFEGRMDRGAQRAQLFGIGDEPLALETGMSNTDRTRSRCRVRRRSSGYAPCWTREMIRA